jgi:phospholipid-transporting ATPase
MVTLEAVKLIQGIIMSTDSNMKTDGLPLTVQSSNLNEELGQIKFVFSDKTGTLTCNKMDFKKIMINGKTYGNITEDQDKYIKEYQDFPKVTNVDFHDMNLLEILNDRNNNQYEIVKHTMFFLALCHSVVAENKGNEVIYNTSSPDEIALINFAKFCGFEFKGLVEGNYLLVEFKGQIYQFKLLQTFDFDSSRKRQSIIFENEDQEIFLYCKGADSVLENQLSSSNKLINFRFLS